MSTLTSRGPQIELKSEKDLARYFHRFSKRRECIRVGLEAEFFAVYSDTGKALPYDGVPGIQALLKTLSEKFAYERILEEGNIIALKRGDLMITLEPGGQMELSAPPVRDIFAIERQLCKFLKELRIIREIFPNVAWLAAGMQPFSPIDEITLVPKKRYRIMWDYFKTHGTLSHEMMKRTCTNQINVDYLSEENAMSNMRVALGITSIVSAMFANSPFTEGKPNGFMTRRMEIWNHTDPTRAGLISKFTKPGLKFGDYLEYVLDMPVIFVVRNNQWVPIGSLTFREYLQKGFSGHRATLADFELHLSTAFPEVRIKQYLEVRGIDCQDPYLIPSVGAFWKGILYNEAARDEAWKLVSWATEEERVKLHADMPRLGLQARLGNKPILPIAQELVNLSCTSLGMQKVESEDRSECVFLERIRERITRPGKSPAEALLEKWQGEFGHSKARLIRELDILK